MEKDENRTNLIIIIVLSVVLILVSIFVLINHFLTKDSIKDNEQEVVDNSGDDINTDVITTNYDSYNIGDMVTLIDSSSWHVINTSSNTENEVTLLKDEMTNSYIQVSEVSSYLQNTYSKMLRDSLGTTSDKISNVQLLTINDLKRIMNTNEIEIGYSINSSFSWLYQSNTLLNEETDDGNAILINNGNIIEGINNDIWPVRPVITITKDLIKK